VCVYERPAAARVCAPKRGGSSLAACSRTLEHQCTVCAKGGALVCVCVGQ
jgi:hypothetical protein